MNTNTINSFQQPELRAQSGDPCPASGVWKSLGSFTTTAVFSAQALMPMYGGEAVIWIFLYTC